MWFDPWDAAMYAVVNMVQSGYLIVFSVLSCGSDVWPQSVVNIGVNIS